MCNRHSSVMFALYCVNTEIKIHAAHMKYKKDERIFFTHFVSLQPFGLRHDFDRICKTFPKLTHYIIWNIMISFCKVKETGSVADVP